MAAAQAVPVATPGKHVGHLARVSEWLLVVHHYLGEQRRPVPVAADTRRAARAQPLLTGPENFKVAFQELDLRDLEILLLCRLKICTNRLVAENKKMTRQPQKFAWGSHNFHKILLKFIVNFLLIEENSKLKTEINIMRP